MVDFAGWDMPLHYGSQIEEHHQVRRQAGMFDVSHMLAIDLEGEGARPLLLKLLANDIGKLAAPGRALYSCMLNERGGVIDDLIAYYFRPDFYRLVVNAGCADKDLEWIRRHAAGATVLPRRDLAMIAVQGPAARRKVWAALPETEEASAELRPFNAAWQGERLIARTGYTGEDGFEIMLPAQDAAAAWEALLDAGVHPAGLGARDTLRLEAGMSLYGQDMDEEVSPLDAGLGWTVELDSPRDFIGKAATAALQPKWKALGLLLADRGVLRPQQKVLTARGEGEVTSGGFAPTLDRSIALARLPAGVAFGEAVEVMVRGKPLKATVVKPPFVRNGQVLISL